MDPYQIILADDHALVRSGIRKMIGERADLHVLGEASEGLELLDLLNHLTPEMVVLDISMPNLRGIEAIHEIRLKQPEVKILILTMHRDIELLQMAVAAGADGYVLKEDAEVELFSAIDSVRQGKMYISPLLREGVTDNWVQTLRLGTRRFSPILTVREREVLKLFGEGKAKREIADLLNISIRTVEHHRENILTKLDLKTTVDLVRFALRNNLA